MENYIFEGLKQFAQWLAAIYFVVLVVGWAYSASPLGRDDSDEPGWFGKRSDVKIITDYKTGLQYIVTPRGGITPRVWHDGMQIQIDVKNGEK